ncbi:MAG: hypothetical protein N2691_05865 [Patescibacteria group bacterium]|nr:hypothetical protein [Patescibacteria group bacterium]
MPSRISAQVGFREPLLIEREAVYLAEKKFVTTSGMTAATRQVVSALLRQFVEDSGGSAQAMIPENVSVLSRYTEDAYLTEPIRLSAWVIPGMPAAGMTAIFHASDAPDRAGSRMFILCAMPAPERWPPVGEYSAG